MKPLSKVFNYYDVTLTAPKCTVHAASRNAADFWNLMALSPLLACQEMNINDLFLYEWDEDE